MLAMSDLAFTYRRGGEELFGGISHTFATGAVTAVTGPSGRGKSTLLYVLGLMLTPTRGSVSLDGEQVSTASDARRSQIRAQHIGFVFQDAALDPSRTIADAVLEPALHAGWRLHHARTRAQVLLQQMGLEHRSEHRPGQISGGQAQRVAVCRALVTDPPVVLADEPTGNLDRDNARGVLAALADAASSPDGARTVVIATHDPYVVDFADEVLAL